MRVEIHRRADPTGPKPTPKKPNEPSGKIQERNNKQVDERNSVGLFLALVDDECHEIIPGSHSRWRTPFEHDVLLPQRMKEAGVPHTPSWDGESPLPGQDRVRLKAGQALIRIGTNIHTGHTVPERERNTLVMGWSKGGPSEDEPKTCDARTAWQLDPAVREAMPHEWMKTAWDRWAATTKLGDTPEDRYAAWDIKHIKAGNVLGWRSSLSGKPPHRPKANESVPERSGGSQIASDRHTYLPYSSRAKQAFSYSASSPIHFLHISSSGSLNPLAARNKERILAQQAQQATITRVTSTRLYRLRNRSGIVCPVLEPRVIHRQKKR